jgi:hypothetical protein
LEYFGVDGCFDEVDAPRRLFSFKHAYEFIEIRGGLIKEQFRHVSFLTH